MNPSIKFTVQCERGWPNRKGKVLKGWGKKRKKKKDSNNNNNKKGESLKHFKLSKTPVNQSQRECNSEFH